MTNDEKPHPLNVPGDFYVIDGCCTACDVPHNEAPELFAYDSSNHCYVKRQPSTDGELDKALRVTWAAEFQCVRYRGSNANTIRRIAEMGNAELCDSAVATSIAPVFRNYATFECRTRHSLIPEQLAIEFKQSLIDNARELPGFSFKPISATAGRAELSFAWYEENFYTVNFSDAEQSRWSVFQSPDEAIGSRGVSMMIHDWISGETSFINVRWYCESDQSPSIGWQATPW